MKITSTLAAAQATTTRPFDRSFLVSAALLLGLYLMVSSFAWTGFVASDDYYYVDAGRGWLNRFPYIATHFGTIRASIGIPMALGISMAGDTEFGASLSTLSFWLLTLMVVFAALYRRFGPRAALVSGCILATFPLFALKASTPNADQPELFFVIVSVLLFLHACETPSVSRSALVLSGIALGLAFSAHEICIGLMLFYSILFIARHGPSRPSYFLIGLGFLTVIAGESLYYLIVADDPLHRFKLLQDGTRVVDRVQPAFLGISDSGTLHIWTPIDAIVMFFTKHELSLVGFLAIPALRWAYSRAEPPSHAQRVARFLAALAACWFIFAAVALINLKLLPRYYMVTAFCLCLIIGLWISTRVFPRNPKLAAVVLLLLLGANFLAIAVDNKNPRFAERALAQLSPSTTRTIYTDARTAQAARWYCAWQGSSCVNISSGVPGAEDLFFLNFSRMRQLPASPGTQGSSPQLLREVVPPVGFLGALAIRAGLDAVVPARIFNKIVRPNPPSYLYRLGKPATPVSARQTP